MKKNLLPLITVLLFSSYAFAEDSNNLKLNISLANKQNNALHHSNVSFIDSQTHKLLDSSTINCENDNCSVTLKNIDNIPQENNYKVVVKDNANYLIGASNIKLIPNLPSQAQQSIRLNTFATGRLLLEQAADQQNMDLETIKSNIRKNQPNFDGDIYQFVGSYYQQNGSLQGLGIDLNNYKYNPAIQNISLFYPYNNNIYQNIIMLGSDCHTKSNIKAGVGMGIGIVTALAGNPVAGITGIIGAATDMALDSADGCPPTIDDVMDRLDQLSDQINALQQDIGEVKAILEEFINVYDLNTLYTKHEDLVRNVNAINANYNIIYNAIAGTGANPDEILTKNTHSKEFKTLASTFANNPLLLSSVTLASQNLSGSAFIEYISTLQRVFKTQTDKIGELNNYRTLFDKYNSILLIEFTSMTEALQKAETLNNIAIAIVDRDPSYSSSVQIAEKLPSASYEKRVEALDKTYVARFDSVAHSFKDNTIPTPTKFELNGLKYPYQEGITANDVILGVYKTKYSDYPIAFITYNKVSEKIEVNIRDLKNSRFIHQSSIYKQRYNDPSHKLYLTYIITAKGIYDYTLPITFEVPAKPVDDNLELYLSSIENKL